MTPIRANASRHQSLVSEQHRGQVWYMVHHLPESAIEAIRALQHLYDRIIYELDRYRSHAVETGDIARQEKADWLKQRIETKGLKIKDDLERKIRMVGPTDHQQLRIAIQAAEEFIDFPIHRSPKTPEDWDLLWDWAKEILLSLRASFRYLLDEDGGTIDTPEVREAVPPGPLLLDAYSSDNATRMWTIREGMRQVRQVDDRHFFGAA